MRIEAQGKYLQSVLKKAQETLAGYSSSSLGVEFAKAELSRLLSMVNSGCPSSSLSELTDTKDLNLSLEHMERKQMRGTISSMESSLTSSESSGRREDQKKAMNDCSSGGEGDEPQKSNTNSVELELALMDGHHPEDKPWNGHNRKRSGSTVSDGVCVEQSVSKRPTNSDHLRKSGLLGKIDLNCKYQNDIDSGSKAIDLNCKGI